jgi:putative membrane protein
MKRTLKKLMTFTEDYQKKEEIILRDHLAMERTKLANERTLLSYIRTSLYLILGGIAFLSTQIAQMRHLGFISLGMSIVILFIGIIRFYQLKKHLTKMYLPLPREEKQAPEQQQNISLQPENTPETGKKQNL